MKEHELPVDGPTKRLLLGLEEIAALAQTGLAYAEDPYDIERYERLRAIAADLLGARADAPAEKVLDWLSLDAGYATPKLDVRAVILRGETLLLVQERSDGDWALPGGWCDIDLSPGASVEKEVIEETGLEVRAVRLLALFDKRKHDYPFQIPHAYKGFFLCAERGGELLNGTAETQAARFFPIDSLPPLSLNRNTASQLHRVVALARDEAQPAAFD